jgi:hypothetical protein
MLSTLNPKTSLLASFAAASAYAAPYRHWLLHDVLPDGVVDEICALPVPAPAIQDTFGRRETHNSSRLFFGADQQWQFPVCARLAKALQDADCTESLRAITGANLAGSFLRIEYCLDTNGFWLEPHTDIGAKFFTMLIYLNDPPGGEEWGTDIYEAPAKRLGPAPGGRNRGLIFVPGQDTWHGFEKRPITGVRRSLIVNYVTPDWRARHELAFPDQPIA